MAKELPDFELIRAIPIFSSLSDEELTEIINSPDNTIEEYQIKDLIIRESEVGDCMYVIVDGAVEVFIRGAGGGVIGREVSIATLRKGDFFGERSLNIDTTGRRKASVRAFTPTKVFRIDKKHVHLSVENKSDETVTAFTLLTMPGAVKEESEVKKLIKGMRMFQSLSEAEFETIDTWTETVEVGPGDFVLKESEKGDCLYVVLEGIVEIFTMDDDGRITVLAELEKGAYFGEQALLPGSSGERNAYARTNDVSKLIKIPKAYFRLVLNRDSVLATALKKVGEAQQSEIDKIQK